MVQIKIERGELLLLNANIEILNQCFKDLKDFRQEDKSKLLIVLANHDMYYKKIKNMLNKAIDL